MIRIMVCTGLILVLQFVTSFWWWIMLIPFLYGILSSRSVREGFRTGTISAGFTWLAMSIYMYFTGSKIIASRVGSMFGLPISWLVIVVTALVAALAGAIAGLAGSLMKKAFAPK